jgi:hypothetical protein
MGLRDVDLGTVLSILADPDGRMSTDHNRTPVEKPQVEGALQESCEYVPHCFRNRRCGEDLNKDDTPNSSSTLSPVRVILDLFSLKWWAGNWERLCLEAELVVVALKNALMLLYWLPISTPTRRQAFGGVSGC